MLVTARIGQRDAFDMLHHDPGRAVVERPGVVHPRDRRMVELRQRALLRRKALAPARGHPGVAQHLDRRLRAEVVPFGKVDDAHAAFADQARYAVGTDATPDRPR